MSKAKRGRKALGLSLVAAMGLMAFMATGASAVTWDINGAEIKANENFTGKLKMGQTALLLIPNQKLVIHCTGFTVNQGLIRTDSTAHLKLTYTGCTTKVNGSENAKCKPEILQVSAKILPILHSSKIYLLVEPLTAGQPFTTLHFSEDVCALPPLPTITGSMVFQCENTAGTAQQDCKTATTPQYVGPAPPALFPSDTISYGLNAAELHGKAEISLSGPNAGKTFNALI